MPANWAYLAAALAKGHTFPGTYGTTGGKHLTGKCRVLYYGVTADINALSSPPTGAMVYDTTLFRLKRYTGSAWAEFTDLVHTQNGFMTGNLVVSGSMMDGRDPSVDGAKIDTVGENSNAAGSNMDTSMTSGQTMAKPTTPASVTWGDSDVKFIASQRHIEKGKGSNTTINTAGVVSTNKTAQAFVAGFK